MTFSGHDPSGGAGLQADIETLASLGCHAATVATSLTVQDTRDVTALEPLAPELVVAQARAVLADMPVAAFKIGLLGSAAIARTLRVLLDENQDIPLVVDPITAAGGGTPLAGDDLVAAICDLMPRVTVVTPNSVEAQRLAPGAGDRDACAARLLELGCRYVLVTGTHEATDAVTHSLYGRDGTVDTRTWPRLAHDYHGSGCTLAAAIAGLLARGLEPTDAVREAQAYTWKTLEHGHRPGRGQHLPDRLFWAGDRWPGE
jgi:hydroxymethylpyrimidine/phosphomethylpyrimidine kinase